jgi:hypothetical protein
LGTWVRELDLSLGKYQEQVEILMGASNSFSAWGLKKEKR